VQHRDLEPLSGIVVKFSALRYGLQMNLLHDTPAGSVNVFTLFFACAKHPVCPPFFGL
jgi:hypothetical protein